MTIGQHRQALVDFMLLWGFDVSETNIRTDYDRFTGRWVIVFESLGQATEGDDVDDAFASAKGLVEDLISMRVVH